MSNQLLTDPNALSMFFTDPLYHVKESAPINTTEQPPLQNPPSTQPAAIEFEFMGENTRGILLVVNDKDHPVSNPDGALLLKNILKHLQLTKSDFALLNYSKYPGTTFAMLQNSFKARKALFFGVDQSELGIDQPHSDFMEIDDTQIVFTSNLAVMHADLPAKKQFFKALSAISTW